jgi:tetratricopeptide (TPR) repeat protein
MLPERPSRWPLALAILGTAALAIRLAHLFLLRSTPLFAVLIGDSLQYDTWAQQIAAGDWLGTDVFYQSPLYPYLLGTFYAVAGHEVFAVRVGQAVLGAVSVVLLATAGRRYFDARTGLIAGAMLAIYPPAIFFDGLIQKSSLDLFLISILLAMLGLCLHRPQRRWLLFAGAALGALALNRENARVLYPVMALWLFTEARQRSVPLGSSVRAVLLFTAGLAIVVLPVAIRNAYVGGEFLISTAQSGPNFYIGNRLGATGTYHALVEGRGDAPYEREDATRLAREATGRPLSAGEVSDYWWHRAFDEIRQDPASWLRLVARKTVLTVAAAEPLDTESLDAYARASWVLRLLRWFTFGVLLALAVPGVWITRVRWRRLWILHASFVVLALSVVMFYVFARYRYPLVPVAMLFAAAGLARLSSFRETPREWAAVAGLSLAVGIALHLPVQPSSDETYLNYGGELVRRGRAADAIPLLEQAVRNAPDRSDARLSLALALQQTGQTARALDELRTAVKIEPASAAVHAGLAAALHQQGQLREAIPHYEEAIRLRSDSVETMSNLALAYVQAGDIPAALAQFERALTVAPSNLPLRMNFCGVLQEAGHAVEAVDCLQQAVALARRPQDTVTAEYALAQALLNVGRTNPAIVSLERALAAARTSGDARAAATIEEALRMVRSHR